MKFLDVRARRFALVVIGSGVLAGVAGSFAATHRVEAAGGHVSPDKAKCASSTKPCASFVNSSSGGGALGSSVGGAGVQGTSTNSYGVSGLSSSSVGVYGTSASYGLYGTTSGGSGYGVVGTVSGSGIGVYAASSTGNGLESFTGSGGDAIYAQGSGTGTGLRVITSTGYGVMSQVGGNLAVYATNSSGNGGDFTGSYIGLLGRSPTSGFPLVLTDTSSNNLFYVDGSGNVSYKGGLFQFARTQNGSTVSTFGAQASAPTVEDTGTAQLVGGVASVSLDPAFAASIDSRSVYRVFVTPDGDTHGLYVASKSPRGFVVRESQGGRSSVGFDYRIVATSSGNAGKRMRVVDPATNDAPHASRPTVPKVNARQITPLPAQH
jgi:hypothetical protein